MNKYFVKNVLTVALRLLTSALLGLILTSYLARMLGPTANGIYALTILLPTLAVMFGNLGFNSSAPYLISKQGADARSIVASLFICSAALGIISLAITTGLIQFGFKEWSNQIPSNAALIALLAIPVLMMYTNLVTVFQGLQNFKALGFLTIAPVFFTLILTLIGLPLSNNKLELAILFWVFGYTLALFLTIYLLAVIVRPRITDFKLSKNILLNSLSFGFMAYLGNLVTFANYRINYYLIASYVGLNQLGIYSATIPLTEGIWLLSNAVSNVIFPIVAKNSSDQQYKNHTPSISALVFTSTAIFSGVLAILSDWLINFLFGIEYAEAATILQILLPGVTIFSISKVLSNDIAGRGRPDINLWITLASLAFNLIFNAILIPMLQLEGAALALSLTLFFYTIVVMAAYSKIAGTPLLRPAVITVEDVQLIFKTVKTKLNS